MMNIALGGRGIDEIVGGQGAGEILDLMVTADMSPADQKLVQAYARKKVIPEGVSGRRDEYAAMPDELGAQLRPQLTKTEKGLLKEGDLGIDFYEPDMQPEGFGRGYDVHNVYEKNVGRDLDTERAILESMELNIGDPLPSHRAVGEVAATRQGLAQQVDDELQQAFAIFEALEKRLPLSHKQNPGLHAVLQDVNFPKEMKAAFLSRLTTFKQRLAALRGKEKPIRRGELQYGVGKPYSVPEHRKIEMLQELLFEAQELNDIMHGPLRGRGEQLNLRFDETEAALMPPSRYEGTESGLNENLPMLTMEESAKRRGTAKQTQEDVLIEALQNVLKGDIPPQRTKPPSPVNELILPQGYGKPGSSVREFDPGFVDRPEPVRTRLGKPSSREQMIADTQLRNANAALLRLHRNRKSEAAAKRAATKRKRTSQPRNDIPPELLRPILAEIDKPSGVANSQITEQQLQQAFPHGFEHPDLEAMLRANMTEPLPEGMSATEFLRRQLDQMELDDIAEEQLSTQSSRAKLAQKMQEIKDTHFAAKRRANIKKVK